MILYMPHRLTRKSRSYINSSVDKEYAGEVVAAGGFWMCV